uniref:Uncharacterized protein n=1 Tax=Cucumis melo TaxID=3656 RepID=A0A9I9EED4_CUCME
MAMAIFLLSASFWFSHRRFDLAAESESVYMLFARSDDLSIRKDCWMSLWLNSKFKELSEKKWWRI